MLKPPSVVSGISTASGSGPGVGELATTTRPVLDMWRSPSRDSERVSQLLMGSRVQVLEKRDGWSRVESADTYRGWIEGRFFSRPVETPFRVDSIFANVSLAGSEFHVRLPMGARLCELSCSASSGDMPALPDGTPLEAIDASCSRVPALASGKPADAATLALQFLGTPYLWGGGSAFGFDCSGLVQFCYAMQGILLRRDADIQRTDCRFSMVQSGKHDRGDLVFFGSPDRITHVGMDLGDGSFVHSAGGTGVIVTQWGDDRFSPSLVDARRLNPDQALELPERHEAADR